MKIEGNELIISGVVATIDRDNIDTDQIIPTEYLKSIKKFGFEDYLFDGWRYLDEGKLGVSKNDREQNPDFILNQAPFDKATILLTRDNFGCGYFQVTEKKGFRCSAAVGYLRPIKNRKNLKIITNAHVKNINFNKNIYKNKVKVIIYIHYFVYTA